MGVDAEKDSLIVVQNCFSIMDQISHLDEVDFIILNVLKTIKVPLFVKLRKGCLNLLDKNFLIDFVSVILINAWIVNLVSIF